MTTLSVELAPRLEGFLDHDKDAALVAAGAEHWREGRYEEAETTLISALRQNPEIGAEVESYACEAFPGGLTYAYRRRS